MGDAVYNFQYCLFAGGVAYAPVDGGSGTGFVQSDNPDGRKGCSNFVDRRKLCKHPGYQLQVVDSVGVFCRVVGGVASVPGEIEKARRKPCFIESFGYEFFLYDGQSGHAVFRLEGSSVESCRRIGFDLPASGDNNVFAGQVAFSPFNGAGLDVSSVFGPQGEPGAGL